MYKKDYTYQLSRDSDDAVVSVNPGFGANPSYEHKKPSGQVFKRKSLKATVTLFGSDFEFVNSENINTQFTLSIYKKGVLEFTGTFYKSDCTPSFDETNLTVKLTTKDQYNEILAKKGDEFDFTTLSPGQTSLRADRDGVFQIYDPTIGIMSNHQENLFWETEVGESYTDEELEDFHFHKMVSFLVDLPGMSPDVSGLYIKDEEPVQGYPQQGTDFTVTHSIGPYRIVQVEAFNAKRFHLINYNTNELLFTTDPVEFSLSPEAAILTENFESEIVNDDTQFFVKDRPLYTRLITNASSVQGIATEVIPIEDIYPVTTYGRAVPIVTTNIVANTKTTLVPNQNGFVTSNECAFITGTKYYLEPNYNINAFYPVAQSNWKCASFWFYYDSVLEDYFEDARTVDTISSSYKLSDLIKALLAQIDSNVTHEETPEYSQFLYGVNPIDNSEITIFITPLKAVYSGNNTPRLTDKIKFSEVETLLWGSYKCKWFIDSQNRFRIEHISFFENGGTYVSTNIGLTISTFKEAHTNLNWDFGQRNLNYQKEEMPRQMVTKWHTQQRDQFDGYPIDVISKFVNEDKRDELTISKFVTDYNYFLATQSITESVFFVLGAEELNGSYKIAYRGITVNGTLYNLQNGYLANIYLHPTFHRYNLPAQDVKINTSATTALSIKKTLRQSIKFATQVEFDEFALIETREGQAEIDQYTEGLGTDEKNLTVHYVAN